MKKQLTDRLGKDAEESPDYSRIINTFHTKRILKMMEGQQDKVYFQNGRTNVEKKFIPPTILVDVDKNHQLIKDEIFGPVLPVLKFTKIDEIIEEINNGEKSLNINYYGDVKSENYSKLKTQTSSGALMANDHMWNYFSSSTGFGGVGNSGTGRIRGFTGFTELSNKKTIIGKFYFFMSFWFFLSPFFIKPFCFFPFFLLIDRKGKRVIYGHAFCLPSKQAKVSSTDEENA